MEYTFSIYIELIGAMKVVEIAPKNVFTGYS